MNSKEGVGSFTEAKDSYKEPAPHHSPATERVDEATTAAPPFTVDIALMLINSNNWMDVKFFMGV